jgi:hypothetical protein
MAQLTPTLVVVFLFAFLSLDASHSIRAAKHDDEGRPIRFNTGRIAEVFRYAMKKSPAFDDLVQTLELQDRIVYIEQGRCLRRPVTSCLLRLMSTPGGKYIQVRVDTREPIKLVVARLAHELYHASEIAREPNVVDDTSLQALFERIGFQNKSCSPPDHCWETRAAVAFEALVTRELDGT